MSSVLLHWNTLRSAGAIEVIRGERFASMLSGLNSRILIFRVTFCRNRVSPFRWVIPTWNLCVILLVNCYFALFLRVSLYWQIFHYKDSFFFFFYVQVLGWFSKLSRWDCSVVWDLKGGIYESHTHVQMAGSAFSGLCMMDYVSDYHQQHIFYIRAFRVGLQQLYHTRVGNNRRLLLNRPGERSTLPFLGSQHSWCVSCS